MVEPPLWKKCQSQNGFIFPKLRGLKIYIYIYTLIYLKPPPRNDLQDSIRGCWKWSITEATPKNEYSNWSFRATTSRRVVIPKVYKTRKINSWNLKNHPIKKNGKSSSNQTSMTLGSKFWIFQALQTPVFFHPFSDVLKLTFSTWPWEKLPCLVHLSLVLPKDQNPWGLRFFCPHLEFKPTKFSIFGWTCDSKMVWDTSPLWQQNKQRFLLVAYMAGVV